MERFDPTQMRFASRNLRCVGGAADGREVPVGANITEVTVGIGHQGTRYSVRFLWAPEQTPDVGVGGRTKGMVEWLAPTDVSDREALLHMLHNWRQA